MDFTTYEPRISALEAGGGGGGDSDYSTAVINVSFNNFPPVSKSVYAAFRVLGPDEYGFTSGATDIDNIGTGGLRNANVILYKGSALLKLPIDPTSVNVAIQGNAEIEEDPESLLIIISGDADISITATA